MSVETGEATDEAAKLARLFNQDPRGLMALLSGQLSVLKSHAQVLMGLCGLTITVTGFSGHLMVRAGWPSTIFMVTGIVLILSAIALTIRTLNKLRWVSQDFNEDLMEMARVVILRRNAEQKQLGTAGALVVGGLGGYLLAVVASAIFNGQA